MKDAFTVCVFSILAVTLAWAEEPVDLDMVNKIRDEGFNRSEVMESLRVLTDEIGPRLTASPGMRAASKWTVDALQSWGVDNVYLESFEFGRGWSMIRSEIHMTSPRRAQLHGLPVEWHPGTDGVLEGEIVHALISSAEDFPKWQGKLKGKMVLIDEVSPPREREYATTRVAEQAMKIVDAGGQVGIGAHGQLQGLGYHWELWSVASGGSNYNALRSATLMGAQMIGLDQDLGSLTAGKLADLVVLNSNPLDDIRNSADIEYVMKGGALYEGDTLNQVWPTQTTLPDQWWWHLAPEETLTH